MPGEGHGGEPIQAGDAALPAALREALGAWVARGRVGPLVQWLERELDPDGVPRRLAVGDWPAAFRGLAGAVAARPEEWPVRLDAVVEPWFGALLRFSRPDGSPAFGSGASGTDIRGLFRGWAERLAEPGLLTVVDWWFPPARPGRHAAPPLPADARPDRPLAILRANWAKDGDFLAVDHRATGPGSLVEFFAHGRPWLGPEWRSASPAMATRARPTLWESQSSADVAEWSFRVGRAQVTRTAVLLRGRRLALLAEQWDGPGDPGAWQLSLAPGVESLPRAERPELSLRAPRSRVSPRALPIGLSSHDAPSGHGRLCQEGRSLVLAQPAAGSRCWRPLLLSWDPRRDRLEPRWQALMVTEDRRVCGPDEACALRVAWKQDESLVIYRSLAATATRAFLGHQTRARFLVGLFNAEGNVEPLLKVEE